MRLFFLSTLVLFSLISYSQKIDNSKYLTSFFKNTSLTKGPIFMDSTSYQNFVDYIINQQKGSIVLGIYQAENKFFKPKIENKEAPSCQKVLDDFTKNLYGGFDFNNSLKDFNLFTKYKFYNLEDLSVYTNKSHQFIALYSQSFGKKYKRFFAKLEEVCSSEKIILTVLTLDPVYLALQNK